MTSVVIKSVTFNSILATDTALQCKQKQILFFLISFLNMFNIHTRSSGPSVGSITRIRYYFTNLDKIIFPGKPKLLATESKRQ